LYERTSQRTSAKDDDHRHLVGTDGVPDITNPHGSRVSNIATLIESFPGTLSLGTELITTLAQADVPRVYFPPFGSRLNLVEVDGLGGSPVKSRIYTFPSFTGLFITFNALSNASAVNWTRDQSGLPALAISMYYNEVEVLWSPASAGATFTTWQKASMNIDSANDIVSLYGRAKLGTGKLADDAGAEFSRLFASFVDITTFTNARRTLIAHFQNVAGTAERDIRIYAVALAGSTFQVGSLEIVFNAYWDHSAGASGEWLRSVAGFNASKIELGNKDVCVWIRQAASADNWTDAQWDGNNLLWNATSGALVVPGNVTSGGTFNHLAPQTYTKVLEGGACIIQNDPVIGMSKAGINTPLSADPETTNAMSACLWSNPPTVSTSVIWPLDLPDGATILSATLGLGVIQNNAGEMRTAVVRNPRTGNSESLKSGPPTYDTIPNAAVFSTKSITITSPYREVVDLSQYNYSVWLGHNTAGARDELVGVAYVEVTYSTTLVQGR
jgi:hypothetical protein